MKIEGRVFKSVETGKFYGVEIPDLGIFTQGKTKAEAYEMAKDAVEAIVNRPGFSVTLLPVDGEVFVVIPNSTKWMISAILKQKRIDRGLTTKEVAERMGEKSVNGYSRYEQGLSIPSIEKLHDIINAIDPEADVILKFG
jgi:hypothetical protein